MKTINQECKISVYFPPEAMREISQTAERLNRPRSWVLQQAWDMTKKLLLKTPSPYKERWKNDFLNVVSEITNRTSQYSEKEIEAFAVSEARNRKRAKK